MAPGSPAASLPVGVSTGVSNVKLSFGLWDSLQRCCRRRRRASATDTNVAATQIHTRPALARPAVARAADAAAPAAATDIPTLLHLMMRHGTPERSDATAGSVGCRHGAVDAVDDAPELVPGVGATSAMDAAIASATASHVLLLGAARSLAAAGSSRRPTAATATVRRHRDRDGDDRRRHAAVTTSPHDGRAAALSTATAVPSS